MPRPIVERSRKVAGRLNGGVGFLMKKNKIAVIWGEATIEAPGKLSVKASKSEAPKGALPPGAYQAKHIIVATGARPRVLPGLEPDKKLIWTYFEAMVPPAVPKSLLVVGSGAIGIEFASFFRTLGAEVTVVEVLPQILPVEDADFHRGAPEESRFHAGRSRLRIPDQCLHDRARRLHTEGGGDARLQPLVVEQPRFPGHRSPGRAQRRPGARAHGQPHHDQPSDPHPRASHRGDVHRRRLGAESGALARNDRGHGGRADARIRVRRRQSGRLGVSTATSRTT